MKLSQDALQELYAWIDQIPLSKPKRNVARDFSDGVMVAEVVKHFLPKLVDMHNYIPANSTQQKLSNWQLLNRKVFFKLHFHISEETLKMLVKSSPGIIEPVLSTLRQKIEEELNGIQDVKDYNHETDVSYQGYIPVRAHTLVKGCQLNPEIWSNTQSFRLLSQRKYSTCNYHLDQSKNISRMSQPGHVSSAFKKRKQKWIRRKGGDEEAEMRDPCIPTWILKFKFY
ncbi:sperm flagellar protein 1 isoform X4 [Narcine bancroftii]|uniref:sperm flagellar protein 1 isoform X4 n=1 Tax=Narcine bancroftii TaxID=1343680 RepID=UPI003831D855